MTYTTLLLHDSARERIRTGAAALADAVRLTLGPRSKSVLIEEPWGPPLVCNDGVTIAKRIRLQDPDENLGVQILRQAAERTGEAVGDGTTTSTLIGYALLADGIRNVVAGTSAIGLKRGLERAGEVALQALVASSRPITTYQEKQQVATISAHNDPVVGELVARAIERVGAEGVVSVEEAKSIETTLDVVEGMQFDRGYLSPYFTTDPEKMQTVLERPYILICDATIAAVDDIVPILEHVLKQGRSLLVVADDVQGEALATMVFNRLRGTFLCAAVKAPGFGDRRKELLRDLAIVCNGQIIAQELGRSLAQVTIEDLGTADRVVVDKESTIIVGGGGDPKAIEDRCRELRSLLEQATTDYDRDLLKERIAKLAGGVAVIRVGAPTESELKSRKEAFEDAIHATQAAVVEGIVPGGGVAFIRMAAAVEESMKDEERTAFAILARALEVPARQIAENSDMDGGVVVERIRGGTGAFGFDAAEGRYGDLFEAGIVDATKVVRVALQNAISIAGTLLLAEATLTERKDPTQDRGEQRLE